MKKALATLTVFAMLLTMLTAMPVSAAVAVGDNLIQNGSFEINAADQSTTIEGWTQVNPDAQLHLWNTVGSQYNPPSDGSFVTYIAAGAGENGLKQEITLDEAADWYVNQENYIFDLSATVYGSSGHPYIEATVYNADKSETATQRFAATGDLTTADIILTGNIMNEVTVGFGTLVNSLETKTKYIEITLGSDSEASWDNIRLVPMLNLVTNGSFEADEGVVYANGTNPAESITGWERAIGTTPFLCNVYRYSQFLVPRDGLQMLHAETGLDLIYQDISIDTEADWFVNQDQYDFILSLAYYHNGKVTVTAYNYDKTVSSEYSFVPGTVFGGSPNYTTRDASLSISDVLAQVGKAAYIRITLGCDAGQAGWDHIRLVPVKKAAAADDNILSNGGFEAGIADGWTDKYAQDAPTEVITDATTAPGGRNYVKLIGAEGVGGALAQEVALSAGKLYDVQFMYKSIEEAAAQFAVTSKDGAQVVYAADLPATGTAWETAAWRTYKARFLTDESCPAEAEFVIKRNPAATEDVYFENAKLTMTDTPAPQPRNLIFNGSFEYDVAGATEFIGWNVTDLGASASSTVTDSGSAAGEKALSHAYDVVSQRVEITDYDKVNSKNYGYTLEFGYASPAGGRLGINISYEFEDESQNLTLTYSGARINADGSWNESEDDWKTIGPIVDAGTYFKYQLGSGFYPVSIDLTPLMPKTESPLKSITVQLNNMGTACTLDNFALYVQKSDIIIADADGGYVTALPEGENITLVTDSIYLGDAADAMLILAQYDVIDEETLELVALDIVSVNEEGKFDAAVLEGMTLAKGEQVIKAYIIEKDTVTPVAVTELK